MSNEHEALKPCPFCGAPAKCCSIGDDDPSNAGGDVIVCTRCQASSHVEFGRKENLVSRWNTRVSTPEVERNAVPDEARGWKCNNCQTVFTSLQQERKSDDANGGAICPYCKAHGQYTYPYDLHKGDPCQGCGIAHDDVPVGPCTPKRATPSPSTDTLVERDSTGRLPGEPFDPAKPIAIARELDTLERLEARRKYAAEVEGDSDNPLRVAKANAILRGEHDDEIVIGREPNQAPMTDTLERREAIARIIDPVAWKTREAHLREVSIWQNRHDPAALAARYAEDAVRIVEPSLAKANAILALTTSPRVDEGQK